MGMKKDSNYQKVKRSPDERHIKEHIENFNTWIPCQSEEDECRWIHIKYGANVVAYSN